MISLDPSINNAGYCVANIEQGLKENKFSIIRYGCIRGAGDDIKYKISYVGDLFCSIVEKYKPSYIVIEVPSITVYGLGNESYKIKRLGDVRKLMMLVYYIYGKLGIASRHFLEIEPSQWQDKAMIKRMGDSKEWSKSLATRIAGTAIENHNIADAICIAHIAFSMYMQREV
jgi:hypothetical protein